MYQAKGMAVLLYKFKSCSGLLYLLDIIVHQRLYCSPYADLNDPFEGQFKTLIKSIGFDPKGIGNDKLRGMLSRTNDNLKKHPRTKFMGLDDIMGAGDHRVCSLTSTCSDVRMWSLYGDSHQGVAIELDFSDSMQHAHQVKYVDALPKLGDSLTAAPTPVDVLTHKTRHWEYEAEYRLIEEQPHFDVTGRIKRVLLGIRTNSAIRELLVKLLPADARLMEMELDHDGTQVRIGREIERIS